MPFDLAIPCQRSDSAKLSTGTEMLCARTFAAKTKGNVNVPGQGGGGVDGARAATVASVLMDLR